MALLVGFGTVRWLTDDDIQYALSKAAIKTDGVFKYPTNSLPPMGPLNPIQGRAACLGVTRHGVVKMWYSSDAQHIQKATAELESYTSMDDLITHAAYAPDRGT